ncbi:MAG: hypothetical protein JWP39_819 [Jatrophihabitans sp.]|nr:hypothetical protein [Jatrophihabitans sp.]
MKIRSTVLTAVAVAALLAGCASVVTGSGTTSRSGGPSGSSTSPDFPSASAAPPSGEPRTPSASSSAAPPSASSGPTAGSDFTCPSIVYRFAHLTFNCITTGLQARTTDKVWPLKETKSVEPNWAMEMGAGHWGPAAGQSLASITQTVRTRMINDTAYGPSPKVETTGGANTTVAGVRAYVLKSTFTINPAYATKNHIKVKLEKSWIVAMQVGPNDISLWYTSLPDLVSNLWASVPTAMASIHVI